MLRRQFLSDIVCGLHDRLDAIPERNRAATRQGRRLIDVRHSDVHAPVATGALRRRSQSVSQKGRRDRRWLTQSSIPRRRQVDRFRRRDPDGSARVLASNIRSD
ncbi:MULTISPECIES: DUF1611 domain-containing protein [unclassified Mesorhizobium]|uniref:DUF1611 domain-containing protein n=1 Tax=unclassified Mesorhizobium TaxID=325217 RepID=UPI00117ED575|nr:MULTISPECIES: DUF1611 domain-containing protein [unclassified Mesorhizobium]